MIDSVVNSFYQYGLYDRRIQAGAVLVCAFKFDVVNKFKKVWAISDIFQGKNIQHHSQDAPQSLRTLHNRLKHSENKPEDSRELIEMALADFFSTPDYETSIKCHLTSLEFSRATFLAPLHELYASAQNASKEELKKNLETCLKIVENQVGRHQGVITKTKGVAKDLLKNGSSMLISQLKNDFHPGQGPDHPLIKIRHLLKQKPSEMRERLLKFQFSKLGKADVTEENLDAMLKENLQEIFKHDPEGFAKVCQEEEVAIDNWSEQNSSVIDQIYIAYQLLREAEPKMPPPPPKLDWNKATLIEKEQSKALDFISSLGILIFYKQIYGGDEQTSKGFYETLAEAQSLTPKERKKKIFAFFEAERTRIGGAWIPWTVQKQLLNLIYCNVKRYVYNFCSETPLFENIEEQLKTSPTASMNFVGDKVSRYFHTLKEDRKVWAQDHAFVMKVEPYLKEKLYERQQDCVGRLNIEFVVSSFNLVTTVDWASTALKNWSNSSLFYDEGYHSVLNKSFLVTKNLLTLMPRILLAVIRLPLILIQEILDSIYQKAIEQVLIHTSILDLVDDVVTEAFLSFPPTHFPLFELALKFLQGVSEIIDNETLDLSEYPEESNQAKRAFEDGVRQLVTFAKMQNSTSTEDMSPENTFFETVLPFAIDKGYDSFLKVHKAYSKEDNEGDQLKDLLQAFNFSAYNSIDSFSESEKENLEKRYTEVNKQIIFYLRKIMTSLFVQTSKEEISPEVGETLQSFLTQVETREYSPLMRKFSDRKKSSYVDLLRKSYIMKGLLLFLMTRDKESSLEA